ncbi:hypothetical protein [Pelomonas sp. Root1444]|uniref:hypothetical protein n=1 Tax=Pelomonas sp. Root1444 TaxID=1736464 RepID=UPI000702D0C0|nr:hypothetical protein [Pelomonas sp. Root1444]KQY88223.1 hypothetical protein ASD35_11525 [Pelomonas sp. Root1444]
MFHCPQCDATLQPDAVVCPRCNASFGEDSTWSPVFRSPKVWTPNEVPAAQRVWYVIVCLIGLAYMGYSLYTGTFYLPNKRGNGATLRGINAYVMCAAVFFWVAHLASYVADHYDRRNNEGAYARFATQTKYWAIAFLVAAIVLPGPGR